MSLSDYEREVLAQMEQALRSDDPEFATSLKGQESPQRAVGRWLLGGLAVVIGLILLVISVSLAAPWLGIIGFIVMFGGCLWAMSKPKGSKNMRVVNHDGATRPATAPRKKQRQPKRGLMERMEDRWDRRDEF